MGKFSSAQRIFVGAMVIGVTATTISPADAADRDRTNLINRIVAAADPGLLEVLVTKQVDDGRPTFSLIKVANLDKAKAVVGSLLGKPNVSVEMNRRVRALVNDPLYSEQWALARTHLNFAGVASMTKKDTRRITVAVVDSGVQGNHPDLVDHMISGYDATSSATTAPTVNNDTCEHGTHVAGIISARSNNGRGVVGLAQRVQIRSVRALKWYKPLLGPGACEGSTATVVRGITWAADHAHVINLSLGSDTSSSAEAAAIKYAISTKKRVVVAAAGNCDPSCTATNYPAAYSGVVGVAATRGNKNRADFSSYGSWVDVAAPGLKVLSTVPGGYAYASGTSMATPYVSATVALGMQHCGWSGSKTIARLRSTASHGQTWNKWTGYGIVRPTALLRC